MINVLFIDDEVEIGEIVTTILENEGFHCTFLSNDLEIHSLLKKETFDLLLLDLHLTHMDGFDLLQEIRTAYPLLPVIILSVRKESYKKVLGFGLGADDYITKPFNNEELVARIKGNIRRARQIKKTVSEKPSEILSVDCYKLDTIQYLLYKNGEKIYLPARLIKLLAFFMKSPDQVFSKEHIYRRVWDDNFFDEQTVIVYIQKLRKAIEDDTAHPRYLETVRGLGYKFNSTPKEFLLSGRDSCQMD